MALNYYFNTETFLATWNEWKDFRKKVLKKPIRDEQRALNLINRLSNGNEQIAYHIIQRSIDNEYQGLFPLPANYQLNINNNGHSVNQTGTKAASRGSAQSFYDAITGQNSR